ncbi:MAG: spore cortex biosynthesis protein YabQ [Clostridiales bacterium]|jgi:spore cortex biosynthesis protein YabQ|nr:spore cortex biosynthesis protein YabQ [Clostridiales bacterium]
MTGISWQAATFLIICAAGFALGIFYDVFRILRKIVRHNAVFISIEDIIFWLAAAALTFFLLMRINFGELRFFIFLALAIGLAIYFSSLSRPILHFGGLLKKGLHKGGKYVKIKATKVRDGVVRLAKKNGESA